MNLPNAEDVNYWRTGSSAPDTWIDKCCKLIAEVDGALIQKGMIWQSGRSVCLIVFSIGDDTYRVGWPVLTTRDGDSDDRRARIQAATFMYHDVKAKVMTAKVLGPRCAFIGNLLVTKNSTIGELTHGQLQKSLPQLVAIGDAP